jgi:phosphatidate cytidylyltransferase
MKQRIVTALWVIPLLLVIIYFVPAWAIALLVAAVAILAAKEFYKMAAHRGEQPLIYLGFLFTLFFIANAYFDNEYTGYLLAAALVFPLVWLLLRWRRETILINWVWTLAGILYIGWMLSHYVALRRLEITLLATFACDTAAFFVGRAWGRHLLAPTISPGKTWEGAIGGFVGAAVAAVVLYVILDVIGLSLPLGYGWIILLGCLIGFFAQLGDLTESLLKRSAGVKDSGGLLPGHGGVLDRIDSVVFTGVIVYYYAICVAEAV